MLQAILFGKCKNIGKIFLSLLKKHFPNIAATTFEKQFENYKKDFNHKQHSKNTELSKYIWSLKDTKIPCSIKWSIVEKVHGETKIDCCPLCVAEKLQLNKIKNKFYNK